LSGMQLHIGIFADTHVSARPGGRLSECDRVNRWIVDDVAQRELDFSVHAGDLYHASSTPLERLIARRFLGGLSQTGIVVLVPGNHDAWRDLGIVDAFRTTHAVKVHEAPGISRMNGAVLGCLPYPRRDDLARAILARGDKVSAVTLRQEARARIGMVGRELAAAGPAQGTRICVAHALMRGRTMSNDQPMAHGTGFDFCDEDFADVPADLFVFGDIHRGQEWTLRGVPAVYPGTSYATDYGELGPKRYVIAHVDGPHVELESVVTPATRLVLLMGSVTEGKFAVSYGEEHRTNAAVTPEMLSGADVRLRYPVPVAERALVERLAAAQREEVLAVGAIACKLEPIPVCVAHLRAPNYKAARTLRDRIEAYWETTKTLPVERHAAVLDLLDELRTEAPERVGGLVRVDAIRFRGIVPFAGEVSVALAELPPFVALVGASGVGKSLILGLLIAGVSGDSPVHGALDRLVGGPNAYLEIEIATTEGAWTIRHDLAEKTVLVTSSDGVLVPMSGRTEYKAWAAKHLPHPDALPYYFSMLPHRNGLAELYDGKLQDGLLQALGSAHYDTLAKLARTRVTDTKTKIAGCAKALQGFAGVNVASAEQLVAARDLAVATAQATLEKLRKDIAARAAWDLATSAVARTAAQLAELRKEVAEGAAALAALAAIEEAVAKETAEKAQLVEIERCMKELKEEGDRTAAAARALALTVRTEQRALDEVQAKGISANLELRYAEMHWALRTGKVETLSSEDERYAKARLRLSALDSIVKELAEAERQEFVALDKIQNAHDGANSTMERAEDRRDEALRDLKEADAIAAAALELPNAKVRAELAEGGRLLAAVRVGVLVEAQKAGTAGRILALREGVGGMMSIASGAQLKASIGTTSTALRQVSELGGKTLRVDDARDDAAMEAELEAARAAVVEATTAWEAAAAQVTTTERLAARAPWIEKAAAQRDAAVVDVAEAKTKLDEIAKQLDGALPAVWSRCVTRAQQVVATTESEVAHCTGKLGGVQWQLNEASQKVQLHEMSMATFKDCQVASREVLAALAPQTWRLQAARRASVRGAVLAEQLAAAEAMHANHAAEVQRLGAEPPLVNRPQAYDVVVKEREAALQRASTEAGAARADLVRARSDAAKAQEFREEQAEYETWNGNWAALAEALDGVQILEVEHEGTAIAAEATERLFADVGPRWTIRYDSIREGTKKKAVEQARWIATHLGDGREREVRACSGGEKVLLSTALFFASASAMIRRWGPVEDWTMSFDESSSSLRGGDVESWMAMLRRGAADLGVGHVLMVPPETPALLEMADARLFVSLDGVCAEEATAA
jgi:DNA repair exonuclease SbcCD nuclease subunit